MGHCNSKHRNDFDVVLIDDGRLTTYETAIRYNLIIERIANEDENEEYWNSKREDGFIVENDNEKELIKREEKKHIQQILLNNFDCYADTWYEVDNKMVEGAVVPAITIDKATELIYEYFLKK